MKTILGWLMNPSALHIGRVTLHASELRRMVWAFFLLAVVIVLTACATIQDKVGPLAKDITSYYCAQPESARVLIRQQVAFAIAPATLKLTCPGDVQNEHESSSTQFERIDGNGYRLAQRWETIPSRRCGTVYGIDYRFGREFDCDHSRAQSD